MAVWPTPGTTGRLVSKCVATSRISGGIDSFNQRADIVGMDGSILLNPRVWEVSGHVSEFNDPEIDCRVCKSRFRADSLIEDGPESLPMGLPVDNSRSLR